MVNESFGEPPASLRLHGKRVPALTVMEELKERLPGAHQEVHRRRNHIPLLLHLARGQTGREEQLSQVAVGKSTTQPSEWEYKVHLIPSQLVVLFCVLTSKTRRKLGTVLYACNPSI